MLFMACLTCVVTSFPIATRGENETPAANRTDDNATVTQNATPVVDDPKAAEQAARFAALEQSLGNTMFEGSFVMKGPAANDRRLHNESYEISSVRHLQGDQWMFIARVKYGQRDVTLPMILPIKWAGDTPVISLTNLAIPGLGTYSARVVIYGDEYAGIWSGGAHGGQLFGRIVKKADDTPPPTTLTPSPTSTPDPFPSAGQPTSGQSEPGQNAQPAPAPTTQPSE